MIVVIGSPLLGVSETGPSAEGLAARVSLAAAAAGATVQLVGKVGEDETGDAVLLALARGGVGHVAVLRHAGKRTGRIEYGDGDGLELPEVDATTFARDSLGLEAADIDLGLRYLTEFGVLVLAAPADPELAAVVARAAGWAGSRLVAVIPAGQPEPPGLPSDSIVFEAPDVDPDGVFASMVGAFAAALEEGGDPADAFAASVESAGWERAPTE